MNPFEQLARAFFADLQARSGRPEEIRDEDVRRLALLIAAAVDEERAACAAIADEIMDLRGSEAAEIIGKQIRARGQEGRT
jgi:hypothetical protein